MTRESEVYSYCVIDASVSLKWVMNDEESVTEAVALRDAAIEGRCEMIAPSLWLYEISNGLVTAVKRGRLPRDVGGQALANLVAIGVSLADPDISAVQERALDYGVAAYDAAYLALAQALGAPLWTGDRRFYETMRAFSSVVRWIGDYRQDSSA